MATSVVVACCFLLFQIVISQEKIYLVNLDAKCLHCLCVAATNCNLTLGCPATYCGPYKISNIYWKDAGQVVMPDDNKDRGQEAFEDCAFNYYCAQRIVTNYFIKYGRDCNGDGVVNCDDYTIMNFNGGFHCGDDLNRNEHGRAWLDRYRTCNPETKL